jgi:thiol-disulfide isomerase/thioredoxin
MALTYTPEGELGSACPKFRLPSVDGKTISGESYADAKALIVMFICNHCPYVKAVEERLLTLAREYAGQPAAFVAICSNDPTDYPEDGPQALFARWKEKSYPFAYLIDEEQTVAKEFGAVCTPDFFIYDHSRKLAYRGRLDDSWKNAALVRKREMKEAIDAILAGRKPADPQIPSMGCSIKWKND